MAEAQKQVLVVDDDAEMRSLLGSLLSRRNLSVDFADDGAAALDLIQSNNYSVVLLDLLMPGTNGFQVLQELHRPGGASPVVLVVTGAERSIVDTLDANQIHGIVRKPFDPDELAALVTACADIKSRGAFGTMAIATMLASSSIIDLLNKFAK